LETLARGTFVLFILEHGPFHSADRDHRFEAIHGNAADPEIVRAANLSAARCLMVAIPDAFEGGQVVEQARKLNATLTIVARAHSEAASEHLIKHGANTVVMSEHETAKAMIASVPAAG